MNTFDWLAGRRLLEVIRHDYSWALVFNDGVTTSIECLWRLVASGRIKRTSEDDGQQFGLLAPVDAAKELSDLIVGAAVTGVVLQEGTLDLEIQFDNGYALQLITNSSGYEAWNFRNATENVVAIGGGELAVVRSRPS